MENPPPNAPADNIFAVDISERTRTELHGDELAHILNHLLSMRPHSWTHWKEKVQESESLRIALDQCNVYSTETVFILGFLTSLYFEDLGVQYALEILRRGKGE